MRRTVMPVLAALAALTPAVALATAGTAAADSGTLFIGSAVEHPDGTATFPLHRGTSPGRTVYYLILDSSDGNRAQTQLSGSPESPGCQPSHHVLSGSSPAVMASERSAVATG